MISPADIGMPPKFRRFRPGQQEAVLDIAASDSRFTLLEAPTGAGKSPIYVSIANLLQARTLILVGTKGLQQQLNGDFSRIGLSDIRGQANYRCVALDTFLSEYGHAGAGCDRGPCHIGVFCPLKQDGGCPYYDARDLARDSRLVVTNYAYWMTLGRFSDPLGIGHFDLLVLDEAHSAPDLLADFCTVDLEAAEVRKLLGTGLPPVDEGIAVWASWARGAVSVAQERYDEERALLEGQPRRITRRLLRLNNLVRDLRELAHADGWQRMDSPKVGARMPGVQTDWVAERTKHGARFSPVWAHAYAEKYLFRGIGKILLTSATMSRTVGRYLGLNPKKTEYVTMPSYFRPQRRPFIFIPTTRVDHRMTKGQKRLLINGMDRIIEGRLDRKGIIHTRSYARAKEIMEYSRFAHIMMRHTPDTTRDAVAAFKRAKPPCILLSPVVEEGVDFPGRECNFQILAKVPFIDGRSPLIKARTKADKRYPIYEAAKALVQQYGRGMRSADDLCETFILDDHWKWFKRRAKPMFPKWFRQAWQYSDNGIPAAPKLPTTR